MCFSWRSLTWLAALAIVLGAAGRTLGQVKKFARFRVGDTTAYGLVEGETVRQLAGNLFGDYQVTGQSHALKDVQLLVPTRPRQVFAMAGNYRSHLSEGRTTTTITTTTTVTADRQTGETTTSTATTEEVRRPGEVPPLFQTPQPFLKTISSLLPHEGEIVLPRDAGTVHYEAEMVVVIGRQARNVSREQARDCVFGVTCGNDVSERAWQDGDVQWWRAKGSDTFGPCGPFIVAGLDYDNLALELRLNGEVRQQERTSLLIHNVVDTVSFISRYATLYPGDLIFTGTPGTTASIAPGDVVEVELEGVGILRNRVVAE